MTRLREEALFAKVLDHLLPVALQVLTLLPVKQLMVMVLDLRILILSHESLRWQPFDRLNHLGLLLNDIIGDLLRSLRLDIVDLFIEHLGQMRIQLDAIHHLLVLGLIV